MAAAPSRYRRAGLPQGELQSVLKFDASGALASFDSAFGAGQWTLQSVTLQLTATPANNSIFNTPAAGLFGIAWMQNDAWIEGTGTPTTPSAKSGITWNSLQGTKFIGAGDEHLGTFAFSGATSGAFSYALGLPPGFTADLLAGGSLEPAPVRGGHHDERRLQLAKLRHRGEPPAAHDHGRPRAGHPGARRMGPGGARRMVPHASKQVIET